MHAAMSFTWQCISLFNTLLPASAIVLWSVQDMWTLLVFLWSTGEASSLSLDLPDQLVVWLEGEDGLLATCRREMEERVSNVDRVVLVEVDNCTRMDQPSGHIPHGRFDSEGRLEGKVCLSILFPHCQRILQGELVITWVEGLDREEEKPNMEVVFLSLKSPPQSIFQEEEICYSVHPGLGVRSIKSTWHSGKPQRRTELRLRNGQVYVLYFFTN